MIIKTLMGLRTLESSVICLKSLVCSLDPTKLIIHLDGLVDFNFKNKLKAELGPAVEFVERDHANGLVRSALKKFPFASSFRESNILAAKIFDLLLVDPQELLIYFDSDIYFNQKVDLSGVLEKRSIVFMEDRRSSYSLRPWDYSLFAKEAVAKKVNTGMIIAKNFNLDLEYIELLLEELLSKAVSHRRPHWLEQTVWAFLAGRGGGAELVGEPFLGFPSAKSRREDLLNYSAVHFVSTFRNQLNLMEPFGSVGREVSRWNSKPSVPLRGVDIFLDDVRRRIKW